MGNIVNNPSRIARFLVNRKQKISEKERIIFALHVLRYMKNTDTDIDAYIMYILKNMYYDDRDIYYIIYEHFIKMSSNVFKEMINSLKLFQPFRLTYFSYMYISTRNDYTVQCEKIESVLEPLHLLYLYMNDMNGFDNYEEYVNIYQVDFNLDKLRVLINPHEMKIHDDVNELLITVDGVLEFVKFLVITKNSHLFDIIIYTIMDIIPNFVIEFFKILINYDSITFLKKYSEIFYGYDISHFLRNASALFLSTFIEYVEPYRRPKKSIINQVWESIMVWSHYVMRGNITNHYAGMYWELEKRYLLGQLNPWYYLKPAFGKFLCSELMPLGEANVFDVEKLFKEGNYVPQCLCNIIFQFIGHTKNINLLKFCF